jgi:hypothetical protein
MDTLHKGDDDDDDDITIIIIIIIKLMVISLTKCRNWNLLHILHNYDARSWIKTGQSFGIGVCGTPYGSDWSSGNCNSIMPMYTVKMDYSMKHYTVGDRILTDTLHVR